MSRFRILPAVVAVAGLPASCSPSRPPAAENLLIITFDTTRADHLSAYGGSAAPVPNLDRLAREGVRFERAFAPTPITLPSHVSLFTGLEPPAHGVRNNGTYRLEDRAFTLAEALREHGFRTAAVIGSQVLDSRYGLDQGFELYDDRLSPGKRSGALIPERTAAAVADRGLAWLGERGPERWFLWLHFFDPHWEYHPPEPYRTRFAASPYDGEIAYADEHAGRVFDFLRERGWIDRTAIVVTSDHGESLGEHGESSHGMFIYDATARVPLLLRFPAALEAGRRVEPLVRLIDVFPTVLELLGISHESVPLHGESLIPLVDGDPAPPRLAWLESWSPRLNFGWSELSGVRDREWKYIRAPRPELYSVEVDPLEQHDLASAQPERAEELDLRLAELEASLAPRSGGPPSRSRELDPETRRALESLGYITLGGSAVGSRADPKDRIGELERILRALALVNRRQWADAISPLQEVVEENPGSAYLLGHLGNALHHAGRHRESIQVLRSSVALDPHDFGTMIRLGNAYFGVGDLEQAATSLRGALTLNPHVGIAYHNLAVIEQKRGRADEAIRLYERAIQEDPDLRRSLINLGILYEDAGRADDAAGLYLRDAELDPRDEEVFLSAASLLMQGSRHREALDVLGRAQQAHPTSPRVPLYRAQVYREMGDVESALQELRAVLALDPTNAEALRGLESLELLRRP